jgi:glycosyltransferase involved in cell wall biosynthesis
MIYFSTTEDLEKSLGVRKKIYSQSRWFAHYTRENVKIILTKNLSVYQEVITQDGDILYSEKLFDVNNLFEKSRFYQKLVNIFSKIIKYDFMQSKIIYMRIGFYDKHLISLLTMLKNQGFKIVLEIPTAVFVNEYLKDLPKGWYKFFGFLLYHKKVYQLADLIVSICEAPPALEGFKNKVLIVGNGIDPLEIPKINPPKFEEELHLIAVSNATYWHGYDRVIAGLSEYYKRYEHPRVYFHIVGDGGELSNLRKLVARLDLANFVKFHGKKTGESLDRLFDMCHIAIGSIGLHRTKLNKASPLKSKEYCARGIPFVIAYEDEGFPEDFPFIFRITPDETPVYIKALVDWYKNLTTEYPDFVQRMREYAIKNLSWEVKLRPVIEKINEMKKNKG